jgi:hypothetical protein
MAKQQTNLVNLLEVRVCVGGATIGAACEALAATAAATTPTLFPTRVTCVTRKPDLESGYELVSEPVSIPYLE